MEEGKHGVVAVGEESVRVKGHCEAIFQQRGEGRVCSRGSTWWLGVSGLWGWGEGEHDLC